MTARLAAFVFLCLALAACGKQQDSSHPTTQEGTGNWEVMKELVGRYPVIEMNGDGTVTGFLNITASAEGVSLGLETLKMASNPVALKAWSTTRSVTAWTKEGSQITQTAGGLNVLYGLGAGVLTVVVDDGARTTLTVSTGKVPGEVWSLRDFFKVFKGRYTIKAAGGAAPHEGANELVVDPDGDPSAEIQAPFCTNVCDSGDNYFPQDKTQVYRRQLGPNHAIYWFLVEGRVYTWEDKNGEITWKNYNYKVNKEAVVLEHVVKYAGLI